MNKQKISMVVAMAKKNRVIGVNNTLPWRLPEDQKFFKEITMGKPMVMGRHTWVSLGRPLPGRRNIVISRDIFYKAEGAEVFHSLREAIATCREDEEICLIGGANVYKQAFHIATDIYLTEVDIDVEGDTFFPEFDMNVWKEISREDFISENKTPYSIVHYQRQSDTL